MRRNMKAPADNEGQAKLPTHKEYADYATG